MASSCQNCEDGGLNVNANSKQRKARYSASLHQRQKYVRAPVAKKLAETLKVKSLMVAQTL